MASHPTVVPNTFLGTGQRGDLETRPRERWEPAAIGLLLLQPVLFFWRVVVNPRAHIPYDLEYFHLPLISFVAQSIRRGIAPLWDPYFYGGMPIHADPSAQLFYPLTWLVILAGGHGQSVYYWVELLVPLHMMLAGLFAFWLLKRMGLRAPAAFFGATVYQLGGYFASQTQHLSAISAAAWLPLAILAVFENRDRVRARWIAILGLAVAMSILAGFAAATFVITISVGLTMLGLLAVGEASWRVIPATAAGFLLGALIGTVELIPLWHLTQVSIASERGRLFLDGGGLPFESLVSLVIPDYYHIFDLGTAYRLPYNFTMLYVYCGIATPALLAMAAWFGKARERAFFILTVLSAFWMLGGHTPVYLFFFRLLLMLVRGALYSEQALMAFCFFAGVTAGMALHRLGKRAPAAILWIVALGTSFDLIRTGSNRPMNSADGGYKEESPGNQLGGSADLVTQLRALVNHTSPPSRIDYLDNTALAPITSAEIFGLPTVDGNNPFMLRRMQSLRPLFSSGEWWERRLPVNRPGSPLLAMLNTEWLLAGKPLPAEQVRAAGLEEPDPVQQARLSGYFAYRIPNALPRFFLVSRIRRSPDEATTFRLLAQPDFHPAEEAIVENIPADRSGLAMGPVTVEAYTPNRIRLAVATSAPAYLATSEAMYTGWEARVNGKPQPLLLTNGAFRGLNLPSGASEIVMEYHPPLLGWYFFFSGALALGAVVVAGAPWRERLRTAAVLIRVPIGLVRRPPRLVRDFVGTVERNRVTLASLALFVPTITLFYWKILLTNQFSLLTESEGVNQAYSWLRFWVNSIRHGELPLWDPFAFAGHSFIGEMQTAAFYPLHLFLALFPLNRHGMISPALYHIWWAGAHLLGACFLFLLARELGLSRFAAFTAGICFSLGGFVARLGWPDMLESSIWLPLIFLFLLRALRGPDNRQLLREASFGGLALGMSILAGGFHVVIMQALVVVSAACFYGAGGAIVDSPSRRWRKAGLAAGTFAIVGLLAGAIQLIPSMEYSARAIRFLGADGGLPANDKIPYQFLSDSLSPHGIVALLLPTAFNGNIGFREVINPYMGVFPLLLAVIGIRRNWAHPWVRYLTGLAVAALLYSFGPFSWLNGVLYAIVPKLWMAREAPRILYLLDFALALAAAFGIETLFTQGKQASWALLNQILFALVIACAACLLVPAIFGKPEISPWIGLSIVLIFCSYGLFRWILHGNRRPFAKVLVVGLILFDLSAFDWTALNIMDVRKNGVDHLQRNLSLEGVNRFLDAQRKPQAAPFRVQVDAVDRKPNIGDLFGIQSPDGGAVTLPADYTGIAGNRDLLNVRYVVKPASAQDPGPVYRDSAWKVYENPGALPRAWLVHELVVSAPAGPPAYDASSTALLNGGINETIEPAVHPEQEGVVFSSYRAQRLELTVRAQSRAMLVLSETFYPGWRATVNGASQRIYKVDGDLRGVVVPRGDSTIVLEYRPLSVYAGALLTILACAAAVAFTRIARSAKEVS
jgi:hypothetical protein